MWHFPSFVYFPSSSELEELVTSATGYKSKLLTENLTNTLSQKGAIRHLFL